MKTDTREQIKNGLILLAFFLFALLSSMNSQAQPDKPINNNGNGCTSPPCNPTPIDSNIPWLFGGGAVLALWFYAYKRKQDEVNRNFKQGV